ncbi:hypothetical protein HG530_008295 [Fusarium avenaceum]|nr:hypothetical protein HG530_008295 [Fusarium avenaceum]
MRDGAPDRSHQAAVKSATSIPAPDHSIVVTAWQRDASLKTADFDVVTALVAGRPVRMAGVVGSWVRRWVDASRVSGLCSSSQWSIGPSSMDVTAIDGKSTLLPEHKNNSIPPLITPSLLNILNPILLQPLIALSNKHLQHPHSLRPKLRRIPRPRSRASQGHITPPEPHGRDLARVASHGTDVDPRNRVLRRRCAGAEEIRAGPWAVEEVEDDVCVGCGGEVRLGGRFLQNDAGVEIELG